MKVALRSALVMAAVCGGSVAAVPAYAVAEQCPTSAESVKVETDGTSNTVQTDLAPGTQVCVKAGTRITTVVVADDGTITQTDITNKRGTPLGISNIVYVPGEPPCEPDPYDPYKCDPDYNPGS